MKVFVAVLLGAAGVVLLIAGANGSAQQLYTSVFGKGTSGKTDVPSPGLLNALGGAGVGSGAGLPGGGMSNQLPGGITVPYSPGTHGPTTFAGTNTLTGQGVLA